MDSTGKMRAWSQMAHWPDVDARFQRCLFQPGADDDAVVANLAIADDALRANDAIAANCCLPADGGKRLNHGVLADLDAGIDKCAGRVGERDAAEHEAFQNAAADR